MSKWGLIKLVGKAASGEPKYVLELVVYLLGKMAERTDNDLDDQAVAYIKQVLDGKTRCKHCGLNPVADHD